MLPRIAESETVGSVLTIVEDIRGRLINGYRPSVGDRIRVLLSGVELQCLKLICTF